MCSRPQEVNARLHTRVQVILMRMRRPNDYVSMKYGVILHGVVPCNCRGDLATVAETILRDGFIYNGSMSHLNCVIHFVQYVCTILRVDSMCIYRA